MDDDRDHDAAATVQAHELIIASLIVGLWLAVFAAGYYGGRDIGSALFG